MGELQSQRMKLTGAAVSVSRDMKVFQRPGSLSLSLCRKRTVQSQNTHIPIHLRRRLRRASLIDRLRSIEVAERQEVNRRVVDDRIDSGPPAIPRPTESQSAARQGWKRGLGSSVLVRGNLLSTRPRITSPRMSFTMALMAASSRRSSG